MEIKTEADSNDITEGAHGDNTSAGMLSFLVHYSELPCESKKTSPSYFCNDFVKPNFF